MTGCAVAQTAIGNGTLGFELRSVNSRYLDLQFRSAEELRALEPALRRLLAIEAAPRQRSTAAWHFAPNPGSAARRAAQCDRARGRRHLIRRSRCAEVSGRRTPRTQPTSCRWPGVAGGKPRRRGRAARRGRSRLARGALDDLAATRARAGAKLAAHRARARPGHGQTRSPSEWRPLVPPRQSRHSGRSSPNG